jgi:hypothetical protein
MSEYRKGFNKALGVFMELPDTEQKKKNELAYLMDKVNPIQFLQLVNEYIEQQEESNNE